MGGNPCREERREEGELTSVTMTAQEAAPGFASARAEFRRRLLDGMAEAIRERGFRESTVGDVVRHARTSRRTFYEHFVSKQECFIALLHESNAEMVRDIAAAVDAHACFDAQVRQAIEAWITSSKSQPHITLSWIREIGSLGDDGRQFQRESLEAFVDLIGNLTDTAELRAAGIVPPPRQFAVMLVGGLRELIATTVEDGGDIGDLTDVAVHATTALLGPRP
jgi:AcrR family transcriptional regulator